MCISGVGSVLFPAELGWIGKGSSAFGFAPNGSGRIGLEFALIRAR